ncbi:MAG: DMT family transporter [Pseudomonadota bacterium]
MTSPNGAPGDVRPWLGMLGGAVAVAIWAGWISATRFAVSDPGTRVDPLVLAICRAGLPALVLAPVILRRGLVPKNTRLGPIILMAIGWGAPFTFFVGNGLMTVPASLFGPLVPGLAPILVTLLAWVILRERPGLNLIAGLALIGFAMVAVLGEWISDGDVAALGGTPWLLMASLGISLYTVMFRLSGLNPVEATAYISLYSLPILAVWALLMPDVLLDPTPGEWAFHLLTQGLLTGVFAVLAYGMAVRHLGAVRGSTANALVPVCAALVGATALGETLSILGWCAVIAASLGVAVVNGMIGALFLNRWR